MNNEAVSVVSSVCIHHNKVSVDGRVAFEQNVSACDNFLDAAYEHLQINYPKFFKMDNLCKTGFLAVELLLRNEAAKQDFAPEGTGVVISTANGSLDTDLRYKESIKTSPSPALFVYTLPNILIGELSIRHRIKGESACFVFGIFDAAFQTEYVNTLFETGRVKRCISGWADYYNGNAEAFFYFAQQDSNTLFLKHNPETIEQLNTLTSHE